MAAPQTGFEATGSWSSLALESAFWQTVADDTDATVTVAGQSVQGRDIYRIDLGTGTTQTLLITSLIHANEPATRDALMAWLRDLAYSTDPGVLDYLTSHRIVALCPCNPDSFPNARVNANGANINRDFYALTQPETKVIMSVVGQVKPDMILDVHEYHGSPSQPDWMGRAGGHPLTHPAIKAMEQDCYDAGHVDMVSQGYTSEPYFDSLLMRSGMSTVAGPNNSVGVLSETNTAHTDADRVLIQKRILDVFRQWHGQNAAACKAAVAQARADAAASTETVPLYTKEYFAQEVDLPRLIGLGGYQLDGPLPEAQQVAFGIEVDAGGFVSMSQTARLVIPTVLDPDSPERAPVQAARVGVPIPDRPVVGWRVFAEGKARKVIAARFHDGTRVNRVQVPGT